MATKVKTTVTFTFDFISNDEVSAISSIRYWFDEQTKQGVQLVKDSDRKEYTYLNTSSSIGNTFKFKTPAKFIEKYSKAEGYHVPVSAMLVHARQANVTATTETIEVEEGK